MTAREMLESYGLLLARRDFLRALGTGGADGTKPRPGGAQDTQRRRLSRQAQALEKRLVRLLDLLGATVEREVLALRYLYRTPYDDIGDALGFSARHVYRLHLRGMALLEEALTREREKERLKKERKRRAR